MPLQKSPNLTVQICLQIYQMIPTRGIMWITGYEYFACRSTLTVTCKREVANIAWKKRNKIEEHTHANYYMIHEVIFLTS